MVYSPAKINRIKTLGANPPHFANIPADTSANIPIDSVALTLLATGDLGHQMDLGALGNRFEQGVLEDLAVDGDRHPLRQMRRDPRIARVERPEQLADGAGLHLELACAPYQAPQIAGQNDPDHGSYSAAAAISPIALSTRGGDIGSAVKRIPSAFSMALAIAAMGGMIGVSPIPRTP